MNHLKNKLKLVIFDSAYANWDDPIVSNLFIKMVALKRAEYGSNYVEPVLPVDTTDFVCSHVLVCVEMSENDLVPVMGYKTTSLETCLDNNLVFPGLNLVRAANAEAQAQAVLEIIERCKKTETGLAYLGSWTVDKKLAAQLKPNYKTDLREIFQFVYNAVYDSQNIDEVILGGTLRFKTDQIFHAMGHRPLELNGIPLRPISVSHLAGEAVIVMHSQGRVPTSRAIEAKWQFLWDNRIHVGTRNDVPLRKTA